MQNQQSITQFGRDPRCCGKLDHKKLAKVLECWPDMEYKIKDCSNIRYVQCTPLYFIYIYYTFFKHLYSMSMFLDSTAILSRWTIYFIHNGHAKENCAHYGSTPR